MLRKLEKYEILEEIGHGGMATVYRARDTRLDREVAVKVLHPHLQRAQEARSRFEREARSVARLRHPNVLEVYDYSGQDSEESFIASELLTGPTLKRFAEKQGAMPAEIAACFVIQIARALAIAHEHGIVHRDVKPENVLIHEDRVVKLTDFGIAQMVDSQSFTATGQILGSPGHMAPEQVEGSDCDPRTDLFSLGTVLYYLAVGRLPFTGRNPHQILKRIVDGDYPDPLRIQPSVGGELAGILGKALHHEPEQRYQSAEEIEQELLAFVQRIGISDPDEMLAAYLEDPAAVSEELRERVIVELTSLGEQAAEQGDVPTALDRFNRVLALDDGNERVLALIDRIGQRGEGRRRTMVVAGIGLGVVGILLGWAGWQMSSDGPGTRGDGSGQVASASADPVGVGQEAGVAASPDASTDVSAEDAGGAGAATDAGAGTEPAQDAGHTRQHPVHHARPLGQRASGQVTGPRVVQLKPDPLGVEVRIDGGELQPFYNKPKLSPGEHTFEFVGECCKTLEITRNIPPGSGPYVIEANLEYADAGLRVVSDVPADVVVIVGNHRVAGRTNSIIAVPMQESDAWATVLVTAEGYKDYKGRARLVAGGGELSRLTVNLEAAEDSP